MDSQQLQSSPSICSQIVSIVVIEDVFASTPFPQFRLAICGRVEFGPVGKRDSVSLRITNQQDGELVGTVDLDSGGDGGSFCKSLPPGSYKLEVHCVSTKQLSS